MFTEIACMELFSLVTSMQGIPIVWDKSCNLLGEELDQLTTSAFSMIVSLHFWQQMAPVLSIFATVMGLCSIAVNTFCLRMKLQSCSPVLH